MRYLLTVAASNEDVAHGHRRALVDAEQNEPERGPAEEEDDGDVGDGKKEDEDGKADDRDDEDESNAQEGGEAPKKGESNENTRYTCIHHLIMDTQTSVCQSGVMS